MINKNKVGYLITKVIIISTIFFVIKNYLIFPKVSLTDILTSLPYLAWTPAGDIEKTGVTKYEPQLSFSGINAYCSYEIPIYYFIDMSGNILHTLQDKTNKNSPWMIFPRKSGHNEELVVA